MSLKDILKKELIGLEIEVTASNNKSLIGKSGKIIDETKQTITIQSKNKKIKLIKSQIKMKTKYNNQTVEIDGNLLVNRPEDRIKKIRSLKNE
ncbi:MAG: ribonuclease P protein subunit [Candidatus Nanoarchaeia archaeon]|nr:ribonuclease P protein subunit [Candidatus Nanoarchaeia archaeon]